MGRIFASLLFLCASPAGAQWLHYPAPGTPRTRDGKPNLSAPAPNRNGKPSLDGVWQIDATPIEELRQQFGPVDTLDVPGDDSGLFSKYMLSVLADYPANESPLLPAAAEIFKQREKRDSADLPYTKCFPAGVPLSATLPFPFKIVQTPGLTLILHESDSLVRQVYTDGRKHTPDPQPTWTGYSVGHWEGEALVVETTGFTDAGWLDATGTPHSQDLRTIERFRRKDFGHLEVQVALNDPKTFSKPVLMRYTAHLLADSDIQENVCLENEKDLQHFR
jgi:hypothetical protein